MTAILPMLPLHAGAAVADIGCGGGAYTLEFARQVGPRGMVYAVDVDSTRLAYVRSQARRMNLLRQLTLVLAEKDDSLLPEAAIDLAFLRNSYHHIASPAAYFAKLGRTLKPNGILAVIDYDPSSRMAGRGHAVDPEEIDRTLTGVGFHLTARFDHLPGQSFQLFAPRTQPAVSKH